MTTFGQAALAFARREIGVKEQPADSNDGPRIRAYLMGHPPEAWCADFGTWCLMQAGFPQPAFNWSYCPAWLAAARAGAMGLRVIGAGEAAHPGDIALYDWGRDGIPDHFGLIEKVSGGGFLAIEGNTSPTNDSNGGAVMLRSRRRDQCAAIVRTPEIPAPGKPFPPPYGGSLRLYIAGHPEPWAGWRECIGPMMNIARHGLDPKVGCWITWRGHTWRGARQVEGVIRRLVHTHVEG